MTPKNRALRAEWTKTHSWSTKRVLEHFTISCRAYYLGAKTIEHAAIVSWVTNVPREDKEAVEAMRMVTISGMYDLPLTRLVEQRLHWSWGKFDRARHRGAAAICAHLNAEHIPVRRRLEAAGVVCCAAG